MVIVGVKILPKPETLDVQGRAIAKTLKRQGYFIEDCHYGKFLRLKIKANNREEALEKAKKNDGICFLCNSLVENYELEVLSPPQSGLKRRGF